MQGFGHDHHGVGAGVDRRQAALAVGPAPRMGIAALVGVNHFLRLGAFELARKIVIRLAAGGVTHLHVTGDFGQVEHRNRDREGGRDGVA